jgi:hypothetical protein
MLGVLAAGRAEAELLLDFPQLTHEDVLAFLAFAAERESETVQREFTTAAAGAVSELHPCAHDRPAKRAWSW